MNKLEIIEFKDELADEDCPICIDKFTNEKEIRKSTVCPHIFHTECIQRWVEERKNCPKCRAEFGREEPFMVPELGTIQFMELIRQPILEAMLATLGQSEQFIGDDENAQSEDEDDEEPDTNIHPEFFELIIEPVSISGIGFPRMNFHLTSDPLPEYFFENQNDEEPDIEDVYTNFYGAAYNNN